MSYIDVDLASIGLIKRALLLALLLSNASIGIAFANSTPSPNVEVNGASTSLLDNIKAHLNIEQESCDITGTQQTTLLKKIHDNVQRASKALGYYELKFTSNLTKKNDCWMLTLDVQPGNPVLFGETDITILGDGRSDPAFIQYLQTLPVKPGQQLDHSVYTTIKNDLSELAVTRGYFNAVYNLSRLQIDKNLYQANIMIEYDTQQRMHFGDIEFNDTILSNLLINRYATFKSGDAYDSNHLNKLQQSLDRSSYFSQVQVYPKMESIQNNQVPIQLELTPRKQRAYRFGVGADTDTGPRLRFNYENRYVNNSGHKLNYDLTLSPIRSETNLNYSLPLRNPAKEHLDFYSGFLSENTDTSEKDLVTLGTAYTYLSQHDWLQTLFLNVQREKFSVANVQNSTDLLIPGISWSKVQIQTQDLLYPSKGWRLQMRLRGSSNQLGSDISFFQTFLSAKAIASIGPGRLLTRIDIGATQVEEIANLPASIRFFAGGDNSVRGYDYQSLGPLGNNGKTAGGTHLLASSLEYDIRLSKQWAIAAFYDLGNAYNADTTPNFKRGAGLGVRWLSPIGPIRLDIARALDDNNGIGIHLSMGPDL